MSEHAFTCPKCGSHYFGTETEKRLGKVVILDTVKCHGKDFSGKMCDWRGVHGRIHKGQTTVPFGLRISEELCSKLHASTTATEPTAQAVAIKILSASIGVEYMHRSVGKPAKST
jgi:hypothetical protein